MKGTNRESMLSLVETSELKEVVAGLKRVKGRVRKVSELIGVTQGGLGGWVLGACGEGGYIDG